MEIKADVARVLEVEVAVAEWRKVMLCPKLVLVEIQTKRWCNLSVL